MSRVTGAAAVAVAAESIGGALLYVGMIVGLMYRIADAAGYLV